MSSITAETIVHQYTENSFREGGRHRFKEVGVILSDPNILEITKKTSILKYIIVTFINDLWNFLFTVYETQKVIIVMIFYSEDQKGVKSTKFW